MTFVLRKIRKAKWYKDPTNKDAALSWLPEGDLEADALNDLQTKGNTLSIFLVETNHSNLDRIATALAAKTDNISNIDYALVDISLLEEIDISFANTLGDTPDDVVNQWHKDIIDLSVSKLVALARIIQHKAIINRKNQKDVQKLILAGISAGHLDINKTSEKMRNKIYSLMNQ